MITRCPQCSTLFKVVADQLRISDGWVRCGQCAQVFDGTANLQTESVDSFAAFAAVAPQPSIPSDTATPADFSDERGLADAALDEPIEHQELDPGLSELEVIALVSEGEPTNSEGDAHSLGATATEAAAQTNGDQDLSIHDVSFVRAARREVFWTRPWLRWVLALSAVALSLGLALQFVVYERDRIAATLPETRPWLQTLCQRLGCVIEPLNGIEFITVDSSSFNRIRGDLYRLQVTLKNTGHTELALPAVELTLTNTLDAAVLRRVLLPTDFATAARSIAAGADWSGALTVSVAGAASPSRIAGYRVLAFYP